MSKLDDLIDKKIIYVEHESPRKIELYVRLTEDAKQKIRDTIVELAKDEMSGCDGYEESTDSIRCRWCGQTPYHPEHDKSRFIKKVEEL